MARQKNQLMRFDDSELSLMKSLFSENEDLLFLFRKSLLQFGLTESEEISVRSAMTPPVALLIRKIFLPELEADAPLFQLSDMVNGLNIEMKSNKTEEEMYIQIDAKDIEIDYLDQQLLVIEGKTSKEAGISLVNLARIKGKEGRQAYVDIIARNWLLSYIDSNIQQVKFLAGKKEESVEDTKKRLSQDSSK